MGQASGVLEMLRKRRAALRGAYDPLWRLEILGRRRAKPRWEEDPVQERFQA